MIDVRNLGNTSTEYVDTIAKLHKKAFPSFFLTQLGLGFLKTLYLGYLENPESGIIVAEEKGEIVGFIAYSKDYPGFFKGLIKKHLFKFGICSVKAVIRHPSFAKKLLSAFGKSESVEKREKYVELASICVDPDSEGKGIGTKMIDTLKEMVDFKEYEFINLETDAVGNEKVNRFYLKNGFKLEREYTTAEGRRMNEYRYRGIKENG